MYFEDGTRELLTQFANRKVKWYEKSTTLLFDAMPFDVVLAADEFEKRLQITCQVSIFDFFDAIPIDYTSLLKDEGDLYLGWNWDCFEGWDAPWIGFIIGHKFDEKLGMFYFTISYETGPCPVFETCNGCYNDRGDYICEYYPNGYNYGEEKEFK